MHLEHAEAEGRAGLAREQRDDLFQAALEQSAAFRKIRCRSAGGVCDQPGNAAARRCDGPPRVVAPARRRARDDLAGDGSGSSNVSPPAASTHSPPMNWRDSRDAFDSGLIELPSISFMGHAEDGLDRPLPPGVCAGLVDLVEVVEGHHASTGNRPCSQSHRARGRKSRGRCHPRRFPGSTRPPVENRVHVEAHVGAERGARRSRRSRRVGAASRPLREHAGTPVVSTRNRRRRRSARDLLERVPSPASIDVGGAELQRELEARGVKVDPDDRRAARDRAAITADSPTVPAPNTAMLIRRAPRGVQHRSGAGLDAASERARRSRAGRVGQRHDVRSRATARVAKLDCPKKCAWTARRRATARSSRRRRAATKLCSKTCSTRAARAAGRAVPHES